MKFGISITPAREQIEFEREHLLRKLKEADKFLMSGNHNLKEKRRYRAGMWYQKARDVYDYVVLAVGDGFPAQCKDIYEHAQNSLAEIKRNLEKAEELPLFF